MVSDVSPYFSLQIWNQFIEKSGEEQEQYLERLDEYVEVSGTLAKVEMEQRMKENDAKDGDETTDAENFLIVGEKDKREGTILKKHESIYPGSPEVKLSSELTFSCVS